MKQQYRNEKPLATPVQYVKGVGPVLADKLSKMGILTVGDLLAVTPTRYLDRRKILAISELAAGKDRTIVGEIVKSGVSFMGRRRKRIYEIIIDDGTGKVSAKFFHFKQKYYEEKFKIGQKFLLSGDVSAFLNKAQFIHPEVEMLGIDAENSVIGKIVPVYPLTEGLYQKTMRKIIRNAWDKFNQDIKPIFSEEFAEKYNLSDPWSCLQEMHFPSSDLDPELLTIGRSQAHRTLIFDEFFFLELGLALRRKNHKIKPGISFPRNDEIYNYFLKSLPFELTDAQKRVVGEIFEDMDAPRPMNRLLQGDVGSGKTVVALIAATRAIAAGYQATIMAPTEILAEQHFDTINKFARSLNFEFGILTSSIKGADRNKILSDLKNGEMKLIVGTHALIQDGVEFQKLGFVTVDEQHRFGVLQRAAIREKGQPSADEPGWPDILIMTATPIPRTLAMTLYGDLDVSVIDELPKGRKPIITRLYEEHNRKKLYDGMYHELKSGRQAYVVYPLIEESEKVDLKNATSMSKEIAGVFEPEFKVALLHGRMSGEDKERIMDLFKSGEIDILVATSVVEVGVDVPNASVMVIEHAERFGLSQLHQLRGRVGRSEYQSFCILMADYRRTEESRTRLGVMVETTDGFKIAEEDLSLRGPGDFLGTRQSGLPPFRIANLARDVGILGQARKAAFQLIEDDPKLAHPSHRRVKEVLVGRWEGRLNLADIS
ncbi:MAG: ATP-dependent DNA helicase RecG [Deltaproteobacteria bacterium]|nr:ATP-dependent DNA helicase RecG [Deltaproteobacteria bacterium]